MEVHFFEPSQRIHVFAAATQSTRDPRSQAGTAEGKNYVSYITCPVLRA
jgi:hypothetical protein